MTPPGRNRREGFGKGGRRGQGGRRGGGRGRGGPGKKKRKVRVSDVDFPVDASTRAYLKTTGVTKRAHPGLLLTKLARWQLEDSRYEDESKQIDWTNDDLAKRSVQIEPACHAANQPIRQDLARAWLERRRATLSPLENTGLCLRLMFGCATDTVLWLSAASPAELGFCLHHVYGIPYLPGSALKGVARAYGEHLLAGRDKESPIDLTQDEFARIFGSSKGENSSNGDSDSAGHVDFLDGVPANGVNMGLDIMTPHHSSYYGDPYNKWPHDCENPIPVPFLRIKSNSRFEVVVVWRGQPSAIASKDSGRLLTKAMDLLTQGAHLMGVGAKTTSGYGILQSIR